MHAGCTLISKFPSKCIGHSLNSNILLEVVYWIDLNKELYNIGWHWGLYENILHASWWYSPSRYGEVNIIMKSAVYSHTTRNKAIQYYYYYIFEADSTQKYLLFSCTLSMYIDVSLQALQLSQHCLALVVRIRQACVWLPNSFLANYCCTLTLLQLLNICTLPGCLYIWLFGDFYEFFSVKASENSM